MLHTPAQFDIRQLQFEISKFLLAKISSGRITVLFFENDGLLIHPLVKTVKIREPREIRGRLRHCNGLQTPIATGPRPGRRERGQARSQDIVLPVLVAVPLAGPLLRQEKDEASPPNCLRRGSLSAFIPRLAESEGFFILWSALKRLQKIPPSVSALVSQSPTLPRLFCGIIERDQSC